MSEPRMAGTRKEFEEYLRNYDRKARGMGSQKDPKVDRFSGLDVRYVFFFFFNRGLSKAAAAEEVLSYASSLIGRSKMGGATADALDKLRTYLPKEQLQSSFSEDPRPVNQFGDPTRTDPGTFAGSYFDYLGTGDPSDPRQFYMYGSEGPVGIARADRPVRTDRFGVPEDKTSFLSDGPLAPYFQTESEYQEENRPSLGDIFGDAAQGAGGAFLDEILKGILGGIRDQIK